MYEIVGKIHFIGAIDIESKRCKQNKGIRCGNVEGGSEKKRKQKREHER
jgi:hypothetical protein